MPTPLKPLAKGLRQASFRTVPFFVEQGERTAGRRTQVHEYPQRNDPYVEDLGRATREFTLTAFVVGADYIDAAEKLLDECERAGSGALVHPWLGTLEVVLKEPAKASYSKALGQCTIELSFVESGKYVFVAQTVAPATAQKSKIAADDLKAASKKNFTKKFKTSKWPDFVALAAAADINKIFAAISLPNIPGLAVLGFINTALSSVRSLQLLIADPKALFAKFVSILGLTDIVGQITTGIDLADAIKQLAQKESVATATTATATTGIELVNDITQLAQKDSFAPITPPLSATDVTVQQYANTNALNELTRLVLLAEAVGLSSTVPVTVHDDTISLRNNLAAAIDAEANKATDEVYDALIAARAAVWLDLTTRAKNSARLTTITPAEAMPILAISYDYYADAARSDEILQRNKVRHPLFVGKPLKVIAAA